MPRAEGSTTFATGDRAPAFDVPVAGTDERVTLGDYAGRWLCLVFLRHTW